LSTSLQPLNSARGLAFWGLILGAIWCPSGLWAESKLAINAVTVKESAGRLVLSVASDKQPSVHVERSPEKWVVEIKDAQLKNPKALEIGKGKVDRIRLGQHGADAWLVIDLNGPLTGQKPPKISGDGFSLDLGPVAHQDKGGSVKAESQAVDKPVVEARVEETSRLAPAAAGLTYRIVDVTLQDQDMEHSQVVITADGPVKYKAAQLEDGRKIVLSILNGSLAWNGASLNDSAISSVHAKAISKDGVPQVRVEIDLHEATAYTINRDQNQLLVSVEKPQVDEGPEAKHGNLDALISLDVQGADLIGTLNSICNQAGFETFHGQSMQALAPPVSLVTVRVEKLPLSRILGNLLGPLLMNYDLQGNIIYFGTAVEISQQKALLPKVTKYYVPRTLDRNTFLTKLKADVQVVDPMLSGSVVLGLDPDSATEGLMFAATKEDMAKLMAIVARLDGPDKAEAGAEDEEDQGGGGRRKTQVFRLRYTRPEDLNVAVASIITSADGTAQGVVQIDPRTRSFVITASPKWLKKVRQLLERLDVELHQVSIETKIIEVNANNDSELGIQWQAQSKSATADPNINAVVNAPVSAVGTLVLSTLQNNLNINATILAMVNEQKATVLSSPRITTQDNQKASITTKDSYTYMNSSVIPTTGSSPYVQNTYVQKDVPITLEVTPQINLENNDIRMLVNFTVTSVVSSAGSGAPPDVSTQSATTLVQVKNGETAVIGGLMRDKVANTENKVPVLGDIPLLGYLFKSKAVVTTKKELVIFLTPTVSED